MILLSSEKTWNSRSDDFSKIIFNLSASVHEFINERYHVTGMKLRHIITTPVRNTKGATDIIRLVCKLEIGLVSKKISIPLAAFNRSIRYILEACTRAVTFGEPSRYRYSL